MKNNIGQNEKKNNILYDENFLHLTSLLFLGLGKRKTIRKNNATISCKLGIKIGKPLLRLSKIRNA